MSGFDNRKNVTRTADAPSFSAVINEGHNVCTASITYKKGYKVGAPGITARSMDILMRELTKLDSAVKFYKRGEDTSTMSAKDAAVLESMRTDPNTSDSQYRMACQSFGVKPQPRNLTATVASKAQPLVPFEAQGDAWIALMQAHGEVFNSGPFVDQNIAIVRQWLKDEGRQSDAASLNQCYAELKAANCFRTVNTLTRDLNGSLIVVQPYSHDRILQLRNQQASDAANAAPAGLSDVDKEVWNAVRAKYPQLAVYSEAFKKCCAQTLVLWATDFVKEQQPELAASNKRGELNRAVDTVIFQWSRQSSPNAGKNLSTRVWLG